MQATPDDWNNMAAPGRRWRHAFRAFMLVMLLCCGLSRLAAGQAAEDAGRLHIAVYPFLADGTINLPHSAFLPDWISQSLAEDLAEAPSLTILERQNIDALLGELQLGTSELVDADTRLRLGRLLGVDYFVFGSYLAVGDRLLVSAHLVRTASGVVVQSADSDGDYLAVKPIVRRLSIKLLNGLGHRVQAEMARSAAPPADLAIKTLYDEGRELEQKGNIPAALSRYRAILKREADNPWAREAVGRLSAARQPDGDGSCPDGKRQVFIVSGIENQVNDATWENRLIAVGLINLVHEELFATGCYLPADTDPQTRRMIQDLVIASWAGTSATSPMERQGNEVPAYDTDVRLIVRSFKKERSRLMLGPFSRGKVTVSVTVELILRPKQGPVRSAVGTGEGVTRSKSLGFKIREDKVHFDESSVGIAVHEAIKAAVKKAMAPS
ncbi:CsgG/HfaB family protein [Desulfosarcina cetonica]|uniref:CsgG/HfaB family protein n=1 Tax=Desulfosarcina cetonica TaxID=90730 RepID=UPI0012ED3DA3|nr:CsgG/HfaB family protein [Desulfosarcina cetonica]